MGYLTDTNFFAAYKLYKTWDEAKIAFPKQYFVSDDHLFSNNEALFGAIIQTAQGHAHRYITMFERTKNGIGLWIRLNERYKGLQFPDETIHRLSCRLLIPYTDSHKGGIVGFIEDFMSVQDEMVTVDPNFEYHARQS
jgi:hypothetical protein